ncbi:TGD2 [Scenedesmus sp. PABB004]|nr:TGD2 [Scenedesmus sp. PABB004]
MLTRAGSVTRELRAGGLVANLDHLTEAAAGAAADIQALQSAVLTDDNVRALRAAVLTLCKTLEHVESISADDEALDGMMMNELQPVSDPVPRLLAEALGSAGAYGGAPTAIPTTTAPPAQSGASAASAGVQSLLAAALALGMF